MRNSGQHYEGGALGGGAKNPLLGGVAAASFFSVTGCAWHGMALQVTYRYKTQKPDAVQRREEGIRTLKNYPSKVPVSGITSES